MTVGWANDDSVSQQIQHIIDERVKTVNFDSFTALINNETV
ncbi:hypothetical protein [Vibrio diabolicus]|nr:hypothetical protein [Vibrio diabolicus]